MIRAISVGNGNMKFWTEGRSLVLRLIWKNAACLFEGSNQEIEVIAVGGSGNYAYEWSTIPPDLDASLSVSQAGTYTVTVTDLESNCQSVKSFEFQAAAENISVVMQGLQPLCLGETDQVLVRGIPIEASRYHYIWPEVTYTEELALHAISEPGLYQVEVYDSQQGCSVSATYEAKFHDMEVGASQRTYYQCDEAPVLLEMKEGFDSYSWSTGENTRSIEYWYIYFNGYGDTCRRC